MAIKFKMELTPKSEDGNSRDFEKPRKKTMSTVLMAIAIINTILSIAFLYLYYNPNDSFAWFIIFMGLTLALPYLWIVCIVEVIIVILILKRKLKEKMNIIFLIFSTPSLIIIVANIKSLPESDSEVMLTSSNFYKNNHYCQEVKYCYNNDTLKRIEYYRSKDTMSLHSKHYKYDEGYIIWLRDSVWTYYNRDGSLQKQERFSMAK